MFHRLRPQTTSATLLLGVVDVGFLVYNNYIRLPCERGVLYTMIHIKRIHINSSHYPDWYTDKDINESSFYTDNKGYTEYYVQKSAIPDYIWELFLCWSKVLQKEARIYFSKYPDGIDESSLQIKVDTGKSLLVFKYKLLDDSIEDNTIVDRFMGNTDNVAKAVDKTHKAINNWINTWSSSEVHDWLCVAIDTICIFETKQYKDLHYNTSQDATELIYQIFSSCLGTPEGQFYEFVYADYKGNYHLELIKIQEYLADFDVEDLWRLYFTLYNILQYPKKYPLDNAPVNLF